MAQARLAERRTHPRFTVFADAEATLSDGTSVHGQLSELSAEGCYIDTLEAIPIGTQIDLRLSDHVSSCELHGRVIYIQSGSGLGIFGLGVLFGEMAADQRSAVHIWLHKITSRCAGPS
jgi:hypothetical protein